MDIIQNYADLLQKIEIVKTQIELLERDVEFWFGKDDAFPFSSKGALLAGMGGASLNVDRINEKINRLNDHLAFYLDIKDEIEGRINKLKGIEYRIAYMRFIENMTYKEIAKELGYSYGRIRNIVSASKTRDNVVTHGVVIS